MQVNVLLTQVFRQWWEIWSRIRNLPDASPAKSYKSLHFSAVLEWLLPREHDMQRYSQTPKVDGFAELPLWQLHKFHIEWSIKATQNLGNSCNTCLCSGTNFIEIFHEGHLQHLHIVDVWDSPAISDAKGCRLTSGLNAVHHGALAIRALCHNAKAWRCLLTWLPNSWKQLKLEHPTAIYGKRHCFQTWFLLCTYSASCLRSFEAVRTMLLHRCAFWGKHQFGAYNFRCHDFSGAHTTASHSAFQALCDTEIYHLDRRCGCDLCATHQDIFHFEIAVNHVSVVDELKPSGCLSHDGFDYALWQALTILDEACQLTALNELHDNHDVLGLGSTRSKCIETSKALANVWMALDLQQNFRLFADWCDFLIAGGIH